MDLSEIRWTDKTEIRFGEYTIFLNCKQKDEKGVAIV